jgi:hypothetical protein
LIEHPHLDIVHQILNTLRDFKILHQDFMLSIYGIQDYAHTPYPIYSIFYLLNHHKKPENTFIMLMSNLDILFGNEDLINLWWDLIQLKLPDDFFNNVIQICKQFHKNPDHFSDAMFNLAWSKQIMQQVEQSQKNPLHDDQNTHTSSINSSSSQSINNLFKLYKEKIPRPKHHKELIKIILNELDELPSSFVLEAAKKCIRRFSESLPIIDIQSKVSLLELLLLSYFAIQDSKLRIGSYTDAQNLWIEGLYEIQRGNNLKLIDTQIIDMGGTDSPICPDGSFAKIIEKLQGIHPAIEMIFISKATASLKLPIIVKEELHDFLKLLIQGNHYHFQYFYDITQKIFIETAPLEHIWNHIEHKIAFRVYQEFHSLFQSITDPNLIAFIGAGIWVEPYPIQNLQRYIQESPHYQHYCNNLIMIRLG